MSKDGVYLQYRKTCVFPLSLATEARYHSWWRRRRRVPREDWWKIVMNYHVQRDRNFHNKTTTWWCRKKRLILANTDDDKVQYLSILLIWNILHAMTQKSIKSIDLSFFMWNQDIHPTLTVPRYFGIEIGRLIEIESIPITNFNPIGVILPVHTTVICFL